MESEEQTPEGGGGGVEVRGEMVKGKSKNAKLFG